jgi:ADP-ribose pyrophosphatase YjhB (NUDIX family)
MQIESSLTNRSGQVLKTFYSESDPLVGLEGKVLQGVHAFCFCRGKLVVVWTPTKNYWTPAGGGIEPGETYEDAVAREVKEETNMRVVSQKFIGFQDVYEPQRIVRQTRSFCIVEPYGDFVSDPDGDVTEIKLIDPKDYKKYFDWGKIGERVMQVATALLEGVEKGQ